MFTILEDITKIGKREIGFNVEAEGKTYDITVDYSLGGMNYFSGKTEPRGIFLHVTPMQRSKRDGMTIVSFMAFSGTKILIEELPRYNKRILELWGKTLLANLETEPHPDVVRLYNHVVEKNKEA